MKEIKFRDLKPEEIEVRVGNAIKDKQGNITGFNLMLYKTARVDANILDETVGIYNWKNSYYQVKNTMVCSISIWDEEKKEWVNKDNGGDDDFSTEQVKAELSDAMKRAGFNVGIGRKLYSANKLYLVVDITSENTMKSRFAVSKVKYDDTSITDIEIINVKTKKTVVSASAKKTTTKATNVDNLPKEEKPNPNETIVSEEQHQQDVITIKEYFESLSDSKVEQFTQWVENVTDYASLRELYLDYKASNRIAKAIRKSGN